MSDGVKFLRTASDEALLRSVAAVIAPPKVRIESSFLLHAPLELLARAWLLRRLAPHARADARRRIAEIAARYADEGPEIESRFKEYPSIDRALQQTAAALRAGDADEVDSALLFLLPRVSVERLRAALADDILPSLGAAGHASILLMLLRGATDLSPDIGAILRAPLRAVALEADQRLGWMDAVAPAMEDETAGLFARLAASPSRIAVSSHAIAPTLLAVERDRYAAGLLAPATRTMTVPEAERILLRVAALSMLQDDPAHAPYGWSHCFTIPQAILSLADVASDPTRVVRIAATYVLAFRATLGSTTLQYPYTPKRGSSDTARQREPADAAASAFNAADDQRQWIRDELIERAAVHADAHLAKYTMACLIAGARDPEQSALYLAAAAYLGAWWERSQQG